MIKLETPRTGATVGLRISKSHRDHWMRPLTGLEYSNCCHASVSQTIDKIKGRGLAMLCNHVILSP